MEQQELETQAKKKKRLKQTGKRRPTHPTDDSETTAAAAAAAEPGEERDGGTGDCTETPLVGAIAEKWNPPRERPPDRSIPNAPPQPTQPHVAHGN